MAQINLLVKMCSGNIKVIKVLQEGITGRDTIGLGVDFDLIMCVLNNERLKEKPHARLRAMFVQLLNGIL